MHRKIIVTNGKTHTYLHLLLQKQQPAIAYIVELRRNNNKYFNQNSNEVQT